MNKENVHPLNAAPKYQDAITVEQRARITQNFRAAKIRLSLKRPLESPLSLPKPDTVLSKSPPSYRFQARRCTSARAPLADANSRGATGDGFGFGFSTPLKSPQARSSALEEELDEAFLKEVDAICERSSTAKKERPSLDTKMTVTVDDIPAVAGLPQACHQGKVLDKYSEYLMKLNEEQREAACSDISVPLMVIAGPGSGKTSTMVGRVLTLLEKGIEPANILAMTFTTGAASEMRDRIAAVVGKAVAKEIPIRTFHSFCLQLCQSHAEKLNRTPEFLIFGHSQQRKAIIEAVRLVESEKKYKTENGPDNLGGFSGSDNAHSFKDKAKKWQKYVTQAKASGTTPEECAIMGDEVGAMILQHYNAILTSCNALDYHDFITSSVKLLTNFHEVHKECQGIWKALVVDEFQDTSSMQYSLLKLLSSHNCVTVVGDDDQSIFSFNGADASGFNSFRRDFPTHREVRLSKNYRSTRCIVEAASSLIHNNSKRCSLKKVITDNSIGCKIIVKECHNEDSECAYIIDKIIELTSESRTDKCSFGNIAILYRRRVSGSAFQLSLRNRKIPFNVHGVAFYRKKAIRAIISILRTTIPECDDGPFRQAFKALISCDKVEKKRMIEYVDKITAARKCSFASAANDIFSAKISGTFKRSQLSQGRKALSMLDMLSRLVKTESSVSVVVSFAANMLPQRYILEQRAIIDVDGGKYLNEDEDHRSVVQYLLDDVSDFLSSYFSYSNDHNEEKGCFNTLKSFIDHITVRETENFRARRRDNDNSVTLTTIHQSKGLEWDTVFIIKANESEIPLLRESNGIVKEGAHMLEEERRLMYVAMTRAQKKLYISYVLMDSNGQLLQPSRFLKEFPAHLLDIQGTVAVKEVGKMSNSTECDLSSEVVRAQHCCGKNEDISVGSVEVDGICLGNGFLKRFCMEDRSVVSQLFHQWGRKQAFQHPKRLLDKVNFVIDERLRSKNCKSKGALRILKSYMNDDEAFRYAEYVLQWEKIPMDKRSQLMHEKQEHFQKKRIEDSMGASEATAKQVAYLQSLGCTISPASRLHASRLIEQYKSL